MSSTTDPDTTRAPWTPLHAQLTQRPLVTGTIPQLLDRAADRFGDWTALTEPDGRATSFGDLAADAAWRRCGPYGRRRP